MAKMNKTQLTHLENRLYAKEQELRRNHPLQADIKKVRNKRGKLFDLRDKTVIAKMTAPEMRKALTDQLQEGHQYGRTLEESLAQAKAGKEFNKQLAALDSEIKKLESQLRIAMAPVETARVKAFDLAVFADSPEKVLETIEAFMGL